MHTLWVGGIMCKYFSCLATKAGVIVWDKMFSSHEELIKKAGLKDDKLEDRDFVRLEYVPNKIGLFTQKKEDWVYSVDEKGTLPKWYTDNEELFKEEAFKKAMESLAPYRKTLPLVKDFVESIKNIPYLKMNGKLKASWHVSFGISLGAAWGAARGAARDAARDAARGAAWDAARDAALFARCLLVKDKIDKKHMKHTTERMEVWKRGFGLLCDVKGKLYVYAIKKKEK
jgi:hypothetical protein